MEAVLKKLCKEIAAMNEAEKIAALNKVRAALHGISPFANEPVDCVLWIKTDAVEANDYNPNVVAPPEMKLLEVSISEDGYTQPVVVYPKEAGRYEVVDGFHRNRVARESKAMGERINGYLPVTVINPEREDRGDRIASTIRHNRARGKHQVVSMTKIVLELKQRNWSNEKIGKHLGMDPDEILRLAQIGGLAEMFKDHEFSEAWEAVAINEDDKLDEVVNG